MNVIRSRRLPHTVLRHIQTPIPERHSEEKLKKRPEKQIPGT